MEKIKCQTSIDNETKQISFLGLQDKPLVIIYSGDVDLTELVSILTTLIDQQIQIEFNINDTIEDEKISLIISTLRSVFDSFNSKISLETETTIPGDEW